LFLPHFPLQTIAQLTGKTHFLSFNCLTDARIGFMIDLSFPYRWRRMNTTIVWIIGGAVTAVILFFIWRWAAAYLCRGLPAPDLYIPLSHYHDAGPPPMPDIEGDLAANESAITGGAEPAEEVGHVEMTVTSHPLLLTPNDRRLLRQNLTDGFDLGELHDLIFLLGLDKDNFPQEKDDLIIDLIQSCLRQGLLRDLLAIGGEKRPFLPWKLERLPD
jgi:hypothetical protein